MKTEIGNDYKDKHEIIFTETEEDYNARSQRTHHIENMTQPISREHSEETTPRTPYYVLTSDIEELNKYIEKKDQEKRTREQEKKEQEKREKEKEQEEYELKRQQEREERQKKIKEIKQQIISVIEESINNSRILQEDKNKDFFLTVLS